MASEQSPSPIQLVTFICIVVFSLKQIVVHKVRIIAHSLGHNVFGYFCWVFHRRRTVDLDEPDLVVFIHHEVKPKDFHRVLPAHNVLPYALQRSPGNFIHLRPNFLIKGISTLHLLEKLAEILLWHHVFFNPIPIDVTYSFCHWVVCKVYFPVLQVLRGVLNSTKSDIALFVSPHSKWL